MATEHALVLVGVELEAATAEVALAAAVLALHHGFVLVEAVGGVVAGFPAVGAEGAFPEHRGEPVGGDFVGLGVDLGFGENPGGVVVDVLLGKLQDRVHHFGVFLQ